MFQLFYATKHNENWKINGKWKQLSKRVHKGNKNIIEHDVSYSFFNICKDRNNTVKKYRHGLHLILPLWAAGFHVQACVGAPLHTQR